MDGMEKNIWVIANWKANKTIAEALEWIDIVGPKLPETENLKIAVCPGYSALSEVKKAVMASHFPLLVGAQDLSPFGQGAYTGEEPAELLQDFCDLAILGHSERRKNFAETDEMIAEKVKQAKDSNIIPLVCVQDTDTAVPEDTQLIAYEPVWAIGSGNPDTPENASAAAAKIKEKWGQELKVLYGGSVSAENAKSFMDMPHLSGILAGTSSLDPDEFLKICQTCVL